MDRKKWNTYGVWGRTCDPTGEKKLQVRLIYNVWHVRTIQTIGTTRPSVGRANPVGGIFGFKCFTQAQNFNTVFVVN